MSADRNETPDAAGDKAGAAGPDPDGTATPEPWHDEREATFEADIERVWRAWADPEIIAGWFADAARGEAVEGGELVHVFDGFDMEIPYRVEVVDRPRRLVLSGSGPGGASFRQEILLEEQEGGRTLLRLVHSGFASDADWDEEVEGMDSGWQLGLAVLGHYLREHFGERRTCLLALRPVALDRERLEGLFRTREGLASWLAESVDAAPADGDAVDLVFPDDRRLHGRVLADSGRELAITWPELRAVIELKAFAAGPAGMAGLRVSGWGEGHELRTLEPTLQAAADRLAVLLSEG